MQSEELPIRPKKQPRPNPPGFRFKSVNKTPAKDIIAYVRSQDLNMSDTKIGRELGKLGLTKSDKKIDGKSLRVWIGIKHS